MTDLLRPIVSMDTDERRQTFMSPTGMGDVLSHFLQQAAATAAVAAEQEQEEPAAVHTPPAAVIKKALPSSGSESARRAAAPTTRRAAAAASTGAASTPRAGGAARPPVHSSTMGSARLASKLGLANGTANQKENATSATSSSRLSVGASSSLSHKRKSSVALGSSSTANSNGLPPSGDKFSATTASSGSLSKKPRMSAAPALTSSRGVNINASATSAGAASPRKQWDLTKRKTMGGSASMSALSSTASMAASPAPVDVAVAVSEAVAAASAAQADILRGWQGTAHWRLAVLRSMRTRLAQSEASLAEVTSLHQSVQAQLAEVEVQLADSQRKYQSLEQAHEVSINSEHMLRLAAEELGATLETLRADMAAQKVAFEAERAKLQQDLAAKTLEFDQTVERLGLSTTSESDLRHRLAASEAALAAEKGARAADEAHRKKLHRMIQDLKGSIRVFCRIRPSSASSSAMIDAEGDNGEPTYTKHPPSADFSEMLSVVAPAGLATRLDGSAAAQARASFTFDKVFSGASASQEDVFRELDDTVISALDSSASVCCAAYGQTGSGKTHTMLGDLSTSADGSLSAQAGMIPRAIARLFSYAEGAAARGWTYTFRASMLEIYNDELINLLAVAPTAAAANGKKGDVAAAASAPAPLRIVANDKSGRTIVAGLEPQSVSNAADVHALLSRGASARSVGATACNARSSRSHTVFTLYIDGVNTLTGENKVQSTLALVDLAGSERLDRSEAASDPRLLKETQHINASLSALVTCMSSIANNNNNGKKTASKQHVSYRSSTLTFLLQDALGARGKDGPPARTLFFVNLAPERDSYAETMCTLRFAEKLKAVEMNATTAGPSSSASAAAAISLSSTASSAALAAAAASAAASTTTAAPAASSGSQTARVTRQRK